MKLANLTAVDKKLHMSIGLTSQHPHICYIPSTPLFVNPYPKKDCRKVCFAKRRWQNKRCFMA